MIDNATVPIQTPDMRGLNETLGELDAHLPKCAIDFSVALGERGSPVSHAPGALGNIQFSFPVLLPDIFMSFCDHRRKF